MDDPDKTNFECNVKFYDETGNIAQRKWNIKAGTSKKFSVSEELEITNKTEDPRYIWCVIEGDPGIGFNAVTYNNKTNNCSGDHGF